MPIIKFSTGSLPINSNLQRVIEKSLSEVNINNLFNYGTPKGEEFIRNSIANLYNNSRSESDDQKIVMKSDDVFITTSAQQGLNISFATLFGSEVESGKTIVLLQQPCFFGVVRLIKKYCLGKSWIDVITFENIDELLEKFKNFQSAASVNRIVIYLCSNYQPNSGNILSEREKSDLCNLVSKNIIETTIIEDNPYDFLYGTEKRPSTLFEILPEKTILIGGFSKILAPGIRVGYLITRNQSFSGRLYREKIDQDLFTSTLSQQVCANALQDVSYLSEWRAFVQKRVQCTVKLLEEIFGEEKKSGKIEWTNIESGIFVYLRFFNSNHEGVASIQKLLEISKNDFELELEPSGYCYLDGCSRLETRINIMLCESEDILREGLERLKIAYHKWTISPNEATSIRSISTEEEKPNKQILKVVITSGGTAVPIDSVRYITNSSTGTTGALIAEEFVKRGHLVYYIHSKNGKVPSKKYPNLILLPYFTFDEYLEVLKQTTIECNPDVVILSAAVSDYGVQQAHEGKISSDLDTQTLTLVKLPKIISLVKHWNPKVFLVGFKLLAGATTETLIDTAYKSGIRNHCNLTVANTTTKDDMSNFGKRIITIITPEKSVISTSVRDLPNALTTHVEKRVSHKHYKTIVIPSDHKDYINYEKVMGESIQTMFSNIQKGYTLGLFDSYFKDETISDMNSHFGFVAMRAPEPYSGFLITSRGSDKSQPSIKDITYISKVDFQARTLHVHSTHRQKASLNANVAGWLFENRPLVNLILHAHIFPSCDNKTDFDYSPGTQEDVDAVARKMSNNEKIVEIPDHGVISVSNSSRIEEAIDALGEGHAYFKFAHLYDMIYARFQKSTDLIDILDREFENKEKVKVLDLACGTGEVSRLMYERGLKNITCADQSDKMLDYAHKKFIDNFGEEIANGIPKHVTSMQDLKVNNEKFDLIVIRQAINYAMNLEGLEMIVKNCYEHLNGGGKLIFNTTNFKLDQEGKFSKLRELNYVATDGHVGIASTSRNEQVPFDVYIREGNLLYRVDSDKGERKEIRMLVHAQHCVVERVIAESGDNFIFDRHVLFDLNKFGMFTQQEITTELLNAQFKHVKCLGKGLIEINEENSNTSPSLYFVATKN